MKIGCSLGDKDLLADRLHDRTYARFLLDESWTEPHFDPKQIVDNFSDLLKSSEFRDGGRSSLYVILEEGDVEVILGRHAMSTLARLGVEMVLW